MSGDALSTFLTNAPPFTLDRGFRSLTSAFTARRAGFDVLVVRLFFFM
jgi:hypothetical protein